MELSPAITTFGRLTLMPFFYAGQRFADVPAATRFRFDAVIGLEYRLAQRWALVSTPFFEVNVFEDGANKGRRDQVYSADVGLQYALSDRLALTTSVVYEHRVSNFEGQSYEMLEVGPHLDFVFYGFRQEGDRGQADGLCSASALQCSGPVTSRTRWWRRSGRGASPAMTGPRAETLRRAGRIRGGLL